MRMLRMGEACPSDTTIQSQIWDWNPELTDEQIFAVFLLLPKAKWLLVTSKEKKGGGMLMLTKNNSELVCASDVCVPFFMHV